MRIGTRSSMMAIAQTEQAAAALKRAFPELAPETVRFTPLGDRDETGRLDRHGGKGGAFVAEIRAALRSGALDVAMHSLKDMPGDEEAPGLVIGAFLAREPAEDVLVLRPGVDANAALSSRLEGLSIGTNAVRRAAYLTRLFPKARAIHFRGAADTRLCKLDEGVPQRLPEGGTVGPADALVMARAGLVRIGQSHRIAHVFSAKDMLPAVGQGIVALECAAGAWEARRRLAAIDDPKSRAAALAEREMLWVLNGHCNSPIAGHAVLSDGGMHLRGAVIGIDGARLVEAEAHGAPDRPRELGRAVGLKLLEKGAGALIEASRV